MSHGKVHRIPTSPKNTGAFSPSIVSRSLLYVLKEDLETRGYTEADVDGKVKTITYGDFVDLIMNDYDKNAWL